MYCIQKITEDIAWIGASDRRLALFENAFPIERGVSYNSYLILDEKTALMDTVDKAVSGQFFENLEHCLNGRELDYVVINHMEPDHCATLEDVVLRHPEVKVVGNAKTLTMIKQFFSFDIDSRFVTVKEGDSLELGKHSLTFVMAPMVHWPEAMVSYDTADKVLFSADAFGTFGALNGNIFADSYDFEGKWLDDARRYYTNIVGKYGAPVQALLKKAATLDIAYLCPLHGPVWRKNLDWFINKYNSWSTYTPEECGVVIIYGSVYGNTENTAEILSFRLADKGVKNIALYDASSTHVSQLVSECFKYSHIVFAASTYNAGIFPAVESAIVDLKAHALRGRTVGIIQNGTWAVTSGKQMSELVASMNDMTILEPTITVKSTLKEEQLSELDALVDAIVADFDK
jgi:flavorubredoxin